MQAAVWSDFVAWRGAGNFEVGVEWSGLPGRTGELFEKGIL